MHKSNKLKSEATIAVLATSGLTPGQKIITKRGFRNIEIIQEGDEILTKEGLWSKCQPMSQSYKGKIYKIKACGNGSLEVTEEHQLWINRDFLWQWIKAKNVIKGDIVCQPWPNFKFQQGDCYICFDQRTTCSKEIKQVYVGLTSAMYELVGYFLGDGCIEYGNSNIEEGCGVGFTFASSDTLNRERVIYLVKNIFNKDITEYPHGENAVRQKFYSKGFSKWLKDNCYRNKEKIVPFEISSLNDSNLRFIIRGLIETDGSYTDNHIGFTSTSPHLAQFVYLSLHRLGLCPSYYCRLPRKGGFIKSTNRFIQGKKEAFEINTTGYEVSNLINWFKNPVGSSRKSILQGASLAHITEITSKKFNGIVYNASVEGNDPSFCTIGIAVR